MEKKSVSSEDEEKFFEIFHDAFADSPSTVESPSALFFWLLDRLQTPRIASPPPNCQSHDLYIYRRFHTILRPIAITSHIDPFDYCHHHVTWCAPSCEHIKVETYFFHLHSALHLLIFILICYLEALSLHRQSTRKTKSIFTFLLCLTLSCVLWSFELFLLFQIDCDAFFHSLSKKFHLCSVRIEIQRPTAPQIKH